MKQITDIEKRMDKVRKSMTTGEAGELVRAHDKSKADLAGFNEKLDGIKAELEELRASGKEALAAGHDLSALETKMNKLRAEISNTQSWIERLDELIPETKALLAEQEEDLRVVASELISPIVDGPTRAEAARLLLLVEDMFRVRDEQVAGLEIEFGIRGSGVGANSYFLRRDLGQFVRVSGPLKEEVAAQLMSANQAAQEAA